MPLRLAPRIFLRWSRVPLILALAWLAGLVWYAGCVPDQLNDSTTPTDAIVVLTGGSERLDAGLSLLRQGMGRKLFVSGVPRGVDLAQLLRQVHHTAGEAECCIVLGHAADNTLGNAAETTAWMHAEGYHSLRLVTSNYHMPRSLLEFRLAMPDAVVIPHPVFPEKVRQDQWWLWPGTAHLIASEYVKYLATWIRHWATPLREQT
jgi:uncharacterized SAM-binding protein YcdF (DUF218 family)